MINFKNKKCKKICDSKLVTINYKMHVNWKIISTLIQY